METAAARQALWVVLAVTGLLVAAFALGVSRGPPQLPTVVYAVETDYRQYDIAVSSGSDSRMLTDDKLSFAPSWSPDGSQIAYLRGEPDTWEECCGYGQIRLWVMDADGSDAHAVTGVLATYGPPQWQSDGRSVLLWVRGDDGPNQIARVDMATGEVTTVLAPYRGSPGVELSPDGTAVVSSEERVQQVVVTSLADGVGEPFMDEVFGNSYDGVWSPDGKWMVLSGLVRGGDDGVWAVSLESGELVLVSQSQGTSYAWASNDQLLICRDVEDTGELWMVDVGDGGKAERVSDDVESMGPANDGGDCLGDDMNVRMATP